MQTISNTNHKSESTSVDKEIKTIGFAILMQTMIRYGAFVAIAYLVLTFMNVWVMAYLSHL